MWRHGRSDRCRTVFLCADVSRNIVRFNKKENAKLVILNKKRKSWSNPVDNNN